MLNDPGLARIAEQLRLPADFAAIPQYRVVADTIAKRAEAGRPMVAAICGPQGSGKSTMAAFVAELLRRKGLATAILSLDDLYLDPEDRPVAIHPLFATRGVPGTHDVGLGMRTIDALFAAGPEAVTPLPRFDKARDRRAAPAEQEAFTGRADVLLFEGWCVGAQPQDETALATPVNRLEAIEDADGRWRRHVNACLAGPYRALFDRIDLLVYLRAPGFEHVLRWRTLQEEKLRARIGGDAPGLMSEAQIARFIMHYERLTRAMFESLPPRADLVAPLDMAQGILSVEPGGGAR